MNALLSSGAEGVPDRELDEELLHMEEALLPSVPATKPEQQELPSDPTKVASPAQRVAEPLLAEPSKMRVKKPNVLKPAKELTRVDAAEASAESGVPAQVTDVSKPAQESARAEAAPASVEPASGSATTAPAGAVREGSTEAKQGSVTLPEISGQPEMGHPSTSAEKAKDEAMRSHDEVADMVRLHAFL
jgi:hypothetical protein